LVGLNPDLRCAAGHRGEVGSLVVDYLTSITSRVFTRIVKMYERKKNTVALEI
jgi:hypothetical protein